jgi:hypothetical protein
VVADPVPGEFRRFPEPFDGVHRDRAHDEQVDRNDGGPDRLGIGFATVPLFGELS